jgi:imidazolonepropionase-like amidohydrolase
MLKKGFLALIVLITISCSESSSQVAEYEEVFLSTYSPQDSGLILIRNGSILTGTGEELLGYDILIQANQIKEVGNSIQPPANSKIIEANGRWITPGLIDIHSHMGVYPSPSLRSNSDGNESSDPVTPHVWAEHSFWTQDTQMPLAIKGGVTTFHVLPGSANLFGGRGVTLKNVWSKSVQGMKFPDAPHSLKMACGENPKRVYGSSRQPKTRMGNVAGYRETWIKAKEYIKDNSQRDLKMDTLKGVLEGEILIQNHCYRGEEMLVMMEIAKEFGYKITTFHHAVEAYKIAEELAKENICVAAWADWWGFKHEAFDMVWENVAIVDQANNGKGCAIVHSDSAIDIQRLNQEAAKAMAAGNRAGFDIPKKRAIQWITLNAAKGLGIADKVGSIEVGKMADIVIWDKDPFSVYAKTELVLVDGIVRYDINDPSTPTPSDFELGIITPETNRL